MTNLNQKKKQVNVSHSARFFPLTDTKEIALFAGILWKRIYPSIFTEVRREGQHGFLDIKKHC